MFFNRYTRIKTEPKISKPDEDYLQNKKKLKIKNMRFSLDHDVRLHLPLPEGISETEPKQIQREKEGPLNCKKASNLDKLPEILSETKEVQVDDPNKKKNFSFQQHKKKEVLLNSILQILRPSVNYEMEKGNKDNHSRELKLGRPIRIDSSPKQYINQFFEQIPNISTNKHHRTPKIINNEIFGFRNSNNIVRRQIYSEDKERIKIEKQKPESNKEKQDLQKIEILTFSSKFPPFKKQQRQQK